MKFSVSIWFLPSFSLDQRGGRQFELQRISHFRHFQILENPHIHYEVFRGGRRLKPNHKTHVSYTPCTHILEIILGNVSHNCCVWNKVSWYKTFPSWISDSSCHHSIDFTSRILSTQFVVENSATYKGPQMGPLMRLPGDSLLYLLNISHTSIKIKHAKKAFNKVA